MKRLRSALPLFLLIAAGVALYASGMLDRFHPTGLLDRQGDLHRQIAAHPVAAGLIQVAAMTVAAATGLPGAVLIVLAGGMLFGVLQGTLLSTIGLILGTSVLFLASRHAFAGADRPPPPLIARIRTGYHAHPVSYTLFLRLVSFFPYGAVTVALAWLRCPLGLFLATSTVGGAVMTAVETSLGAGIAASLARDGRLGLGLVAQRDVVLPMLGMATLALAPILVDRIRTRNRRPAPATD
ncbi:TVP38/TMEM64 family protein [Dokdonella koreensis]|uniref:TVP38/TMEM64 family membrane protein n=1 Tax=Dokdonella koreensis DS-123 TaxID=1300342 RepID=A0A160DT76_9GAMM|nr:VTT domain-containing protein [Dokdonella koreensis]ANB16763.1 Hypothetical protein I596_727 [Dokdonella koreensis DS-123]